MIIKHTGEDFEHHWGFVDWKNKKILDVGADYGSTAECFLAVGADIVYAVEGDEDLYSKLLEYAKNESRVIPYKKWISNPNDFIDMFNKFEVDIVKMDCEGAEVYLLDVPDDIIKSIKEYVIECHSRELSTKIPEKLKNLNFEIVHTMALTADFDVIHAISNDI